MPYWLRTAALGLLNRDNDLALSMTYYGNARALTVNSLKFVRPITQPLIVISQVQKSGGTLLSQLLDNHPELLAHPHQFKPGLHKYIWPKIDTEEDWPTLFNILFEPEVIQSSVHGYWKGSVSRDHLHFPFRFMPVLQRKIFHEQFLATGSSRTIRDIWNAYFTSYFGAWIDQQNAFCKKSYIVAFSPQLLNKEENANDMIAAYPDGLIITTVRNPMDWYVSSRAKGFFGEMESAIDVWIKNTEVALRHSKLYPKNSILLCFEDIAGNTEATMRHLAERLQISFDCTLTTPTFNGIPTITNTGFDVWEPGTVSAAPLQRRNELTSEEQAYITEQTDELYSRFLAIANRPSKT